MFASRVAYNNTSWKLYCQLFLWLHRLLLSDCAASTDFSFHGMQQQQLLLFLLSLWLLLLLSRACNRPKMALNYKSVRL